MPDPPPPAEMPSDGMDLGDRKALLQTFLAEAEERFIEMEEIIVELESRPDDEELVQKLFRGAHTIKGNASCFGFSRVSEFAHALEALLQRLRSRTLAVNEDFGEFIAPDLLKMYGNLIDPGWKTPDLIEHTERTIHTVVRIKNPGARPPELQVSRAGKDEVVITYSSPRKMCAVAKGIAKGLAKYYNEHLVISESSCMLQGRGSCKISVKLAAARLAAA